MKVRLKKKRAFSLLEVTIALFFTSVILTLLFRFFGTVMRMEDGMDKAGIILTQRENVQVRGSQIFSSLSLPSEERDLKSKSSTEDEMSAHLAFYTKKENHFPALIISSFDNGVDPDPLFSGPCQGKLYIDKEKNLIFAITPITLSKDREKSEFSHNGSSSSKEIREERLMENIEKISFSFFGSPPIEEAYTSNLKTQNSFPLSSTLKNDKNPQNDAHKKIEEKKTSSVKSSNKASEKLIWESSWNRNTNSIPAIVKIHIQQKGEKEISFSFFPSTTTERIRYKQKKGALL